MKTVKKYNPNQEWSIIEIPLLSINKEDNTKFDISSYRIRVIDTTDPLSPETWYEDIPKQIGISINGPNRY